MQRRHNANASRARSAVARASCRWIADQTVLARGAIRLGASCLIVCATFASVFSAAKSPAFGQLAIVAPALTPHLERMEVKIVSGRIGVFAQTTGGTISTTAHRDGREERLRLSLHGGSPALEYDQITADYHLAIVARDGQYVSILREPQEDAEIERLEFVQPPGEPLRWTVGTPPDEVTVEAESLWHLLLAESQSAVGELVPLIELLRPNWQLAAMAAELETELLTLALHYPDPRRDVWQRLVDELASPSFTVRERADRALRQVGPIVVGYLQSLPSDSLDAEQRFRVRRIVAALTRHDAEDNPQIVARRLMTDESIWFDLLGRSELATRRIAEAQLERIQGRPLTFDPEAPEEERRQQIQALRNQ